MKIPQPIVMMSSGGVTASASLFLQNSIEVMVPWFFTLFAFVIADLASGYYKAHRLDIHFAWSTAIRESLGKVTVYTAGILAFAMVDVAASGSMAIAKWCCLLLCVVEGGSFISNLLAPYGIKLSLKGLLKLFLKKSPLGISDEEADEIIKIQKRENLKWNMRKHDVDKPTMRTEMTTEQVLDDTFAREGWGAVENNIEKEVDDNGKTYFKVYCDD